MWFCKKQKDPFEDRVKCEVCRRWIDKIDASTLVWKNYSYVYYTSLSMSNSIDQPSHIKFLCPYDRLPYDEIIERGIGEIQYIKHNVTVSEDGTPVGYKKIYDTSVNILNDEK